MLRRELNRDGGMLVLRGLLRERDASETVNETGVQVEHAALSATARLARRTLHARALTIQSEPCLV